MEEYRCPGCGLTLPADELALHPPVHVRCGMVMVLTGRTPEPSGPAKRRTRPCADCGRRFQATGNRQTRCPECANAAARKANAAYMRRYRGKGRSGT
ncbi:MAG: hypothetical protein M0Z27_01290 [Thermaerobacter sp.]|nr:hypothetical protein [Thermaerobacter sp.]